MNIRSKLTLVFLLMSIPLLAMGIINYLNAEQALKQDIFNKLESLASIKEQIIQGEMNNNALDSLSSRPQLNFALQKYIDGVGNKSHFETFINNQIQDFKSVIPNIKQIDLFSPSGKILFSTEKSNVGENYAKDELSINAHKDRNLSVYFTSPLLFDGKFIGAMSVISSGQKILSVLADHTGLGATGESFLAQRDPSGGNLVLTPLRFQSDAPFKVKITRPDAPITHALLQEERTFTDTVDYRGVPVLSATRYLEKQGWGLVIKIDKSEAFAPLEKLKNLTILIGSIVGISAITTAFFFGRSISAPIIALRDAATKITKGIYDVKIKVDSNDEIGQLANQFETMQQSVHHTNSHLNNLVKERTNELEDSLEKLMQNEQELQRLNNSLQVTNDELLTANERLKSHDKVQKEFINVAAHELRTPIQPILTMADSLRSSLKTTEAREAIEIVIRNAKRLERLAEDILDVTKIEGHTLNINFECLNLHTVLTDLVTEFRNQVRNKNKKIKLSYTSSSPDLFVRASKVKITQVVSNLLDNAIKFTVNGKVSVNVSIENNQVIVRVTDSGSGIDADIMPRLFNKFATKSATGTGLGLFISKSIIAAHGGTITARNNEEGGAEFMFSLPFTPLKIEAISQN